MPRYYFNLQNRVGFVSDDEGDDLPDLDAAAASAVVSIRSILKDEIEEGLIDLRGRIEIADDSGRVVAVVPFSQAVELKLQDDRA